MQRSGSLAGGGRNLPHQVHLRDRLPPGAHARLIPLWKTLSVRILTDLNMALPGAAVCEDPHRQRSLQRKQTGVGSRLLQVAVAFSMGMVACKPRLAWFDSPVCTARCLMIIASPAGTPTAFRPAPHHPELRVRLHRLAPSAQADVADVLIWGSGGRERTLHEGLGPLHPAGVRGHHHRVHEPLGLEVLEVHRLCATPEPRVSTLRRH